MNIAEAYSAPLLNSGSNFIAHVFRQARKHGVLVLYLPSPDAEVVRDSIVTLGQVAIMIVDFLVVGSDRIVAIAVVDTLRDRFNSFIEYRIGYEICEPDI